MDIISKFAFPGIAFLLTLVFGVWLSLSGRPYNSIVFNIHKLIALGAVIITAMQIFNALKNTETQALIVILIIIAGICVAALFASGAFMSIGNLNQQNMLTIHRIALALVIIASAMTVYLLNGSTI